MDDWAEKPEHLSSESDPKLGTARLKSSHVFQHDLHFCAS